MMAELLNEALKIIIEKLISGAVGIKQTALEIKSLFQDDLEKMMNTIEVFMVEVDQMQLTPPQLELLKELGRVVQEMLDFQDERQTSIKRRKVMSTSSTSLIQKVSYLASSNPFVHAFKDARQFTSICKDLYLGPLARDIEGTRNLLDMMYKPPQRPTNSQLTLALASEEVIGRDRDRDKILSLLSSSTDHFSVLAITGIGGIGKTTLAQYLYCTEYVKTKFDVLLWVEVGQYFDLEKVLQKMVTFGTGEKNLVDCEMAQLQNCILPLISRKKCLIVLDNVWDHRDLSFNWLELMKLNGYMGDGSRFIITTRSESVARIMSNNDPYRLGDLDAQDAWRLFRKVGCRRQQLEPELERIGREIAWLCGNVPLVIRVIGGLLREKPITVEEWSRFRDELGRRNCCDRESSIMHILKFSYDQLHPKGLKRCFLHFSLFPRGFKVCQNEFIYQWRALGYVEKQENQSETHAAQEYLLCLVNRGLLIHDSLTFYKMHDVIHDLATSLAKSKYKRVDSDDKCDFGDETRHVSFTSTTMFLKEDLLDPSLFHIKDQLRYNQEHPLNLKGLSKLKHLRVLTMYSCIQEVPSTIGKLIHLRYLDLSRNSFKELPDLITQLVNLVYLNLFFCGQLQKLPSDLCKLVDLEFLNLGLCTNLKELPRDINKLEKLLHLNLFGCYNLKHMPTGLGKLTGLQTLFLFVVSGHSWINGDVSGIADLNSLNNLKGLLQIVVGGCCLPPSEVRAANLQAKEKLQELTIEFKEGAYADTEVLEQFRPPSNLTCLVIKGYKGRSPPSWIDDRARFLNLEGLEIYHWAGFSCLGSFGRFPRLTNLRISDCKNMEYIIESPTTTSTSTTESNDDSSASSSLFPRLEELNIEHIPKLKGWRRNCISKSSGSAFPKLKRLIFHNVGLEVVPKEFWGLPLLKNLQLSHCKQLKEIPDWIDTFQSLEDLTIRYCPRLMSLPKQIVNLTNLNRLWIENCPNIKDRCFMPGADGIAFPKLEYLSFAYVGLECFSEVFRGLPLLSDLEFNHCEQLEEIPEWIDTFPSLRRLSIEDCPRLMSLPKQTTNLTNLMELQIQNCPNMKTRSRGKDKCFMLGAGGSSFPKLEILRFDNVGLECFPEEFRGLPLLIYLEFNHCEQLEEIPEWIDTFPSLWNLNIEDCPRLMSLPKQIANLTNLEELNITDCPSLAERCQSQTGEDWHIIQHIPNICIHPEFQNQRFSPV